MQLVYRPWEIYFASGRTLFMGSGFLGPGRVRCASSVERKSAKELLALVGSSN